MFKKRNGQWSAAKITSWATTVTSIIVGIQIAWPYVVKGFRPWLETPQKVESMSRDVSETKANVQLIADRLGINLNDKPSVPENPYLPPHMKTSLAMSTNSPILASKQNHKPQTE